MVTKGLEGRVDLPEGVTASFDEASNSLRVKGPKGEVTKRFLHKAVSIRVAGGAIAFATTGSTLREKKQLFTFVAHARNMVRGVSEGFTYKLRICSGHFPMSVAVKDGVLEVKNFIGEKVPRLLPLKEGVTVKVNGTEVVVSGIDKEIVGQVAADIEQLTRRPGFDTRVFQDGIFIMEKDGRVV